MSDLYRHIDTSDYDEGDWQDLKQTPSAVLHAANEFADELKARRPNIKVDGCPLDDGWGIVMGVEGNREFSAWFYDDGDRSFHYYTPETSHTFLLDDDWDSILEAVDRVKLC